MQKGTIMISKSSRTLSRQITRLGIAKHLTISGAESCTGGLIAKLLTDIPGSSAVFCGACVSYTNEIKRGVLGVSEETINRYTEVSHECAQEMASGALRVFGSDIAYSTTGYAGPGGGTEQDPVGTVYVGIATRQNTVSYRLSLTEEASRAFIRNSAAEFVLEKIKNLLETHLE